MMKRQVHGYGKSNNPTYSKYMAMKQRCVNPHHKSWDRYGGRGIKVCERWMNSFKDFLEDMGECPSEEMSIDRINHNGDYSPENCKWSTKLEQARNSSGNVKIEFRGITYPTITAAAEAFGIPHGTITVRLNAYKWSIERALTTPVFTSHRHKNYRPPSAK